MTLTNPPERSVGDDSRWVMTFTGRKFYPFAPRAEDVSILDIAHHLACVPRHGGAGRWPYSVAEHSILLSRVVPGFLAREALLHDASEYIVGDLQSPIKQSPRMLEFRSVALGIETVVFNAFGVQSDDRTRRAVKSMHARLFVDEVAQLMPRPGEFKAKLEGAKPLGVKLERWIWQRAEQEFIDRFAQLFPAHARNVS